MQLALPLGKWVDEHFETNAWRLSGRLADNRELSLDYVFKLEELDDAWPEFAELLVAGAHPRRGRNSPEALAKLSAPLSDQANHHASINQQTHKSSLLSPEMVELMCESPHFADEWACFDYARPRVCGNKTGL